MFSGHALLIGVLLMLYNCDSGGGGGGVSPSRLVSYYLRSSSYQIKNALIKFFGHAS